jgi:predicted nucleic acid-binding protein
MHTIDSSLLYALFNAKDQWHKEAKRAMQETRPILIPPGILQETLDLLRYRHGFEAAVAALKWLGGADQVVLEGRHGDASFARVLNGYAKEAVEGAFDAKALSVADAWCIAYAIANEAPLVTKDANQEKAFQTLLGRAQ